MGENRSRESFESGCKIGQKCHGRRRFAKTRRSEAFFGRRKAKRLSDPQQELIDKKLPILALDIEKPSPQAATKLFEHQPNKIILEIGFGGGEHLLHQAQLHPESGYIGVEPFVNSMAKALLGIEQKELENIRLYNEDATELLDWLPPASVDHIDLLYPDPWPKKRHWKRRFIGPKNLDRFARILKSGGTFNFASDIDTYINWTLNHVHLHNDFCWSAQSASDWHEPYENWIRTRYEAKALREKGRRATCGLSESKFTSLF